MFMPRGRLSVVHKASAVSSLTSLMNTGRRVVQTPGGLPGCPRHVVVGEEPSGLLKLRLDDVGVPLAPSSLQGTQLFVTSFFKCAFIWKCVCVHVWYLYKDFREETEEQRINDFFHTWSVSATSDLGPTVSIQLIWQINKSGWFIRKVLSVQCDLPHGGQELGGRRWKPVYRRKPRRPPWQLNKSFIASDPSQRCYYEDVSRWASPDVLWSPQARLLHGQLQPSQLFLDVL